MEEIRLSRVFEEMDSLFSTCAERWNKLSLARKEKKRMAFGNAKRVYKFKSFD